MVFSVAALFLKASGANAIGKGFCIIDSALGMRDGAGDLLGSFPASLFL